MFADVLKQEISGLSLLTELPVQIQANRKQGIVGLFLSAKCPCSDSHIKEVRKLFDEFGKDFAFVAIHSNSDEGPDLAKAYFAAAGFSFPVLADRDQKLANELRALKTPHAFVFGPKGELLYQGGVSNSAKFDNADRFFLRDALADLRGGKAVRTPVGRTLGCVISRGEKNVW